MREIKFRAWDKKQKWMTSVVCLNMGTWIDVVLVQPKVEKATYNQLTENIELMQYTGLKDKNGVEIYEGDIVESLEKMFGGNGEKLIREVRFEKGSFVIGSVELSIVTEDMPNGLSFEPRVIGNIYQNPDLLLDNIS